MIPLLPDLSAGEAPRDVRAMGFYGKVKLGKEQHRKDLTEAIIAHEVPYVAQAAPHNFRDLMNKVEKAMVMTIIVNSGLSRVQRKPRKLPR